jgi:hypothetical protein
MIAVASIVLSAIAAAFSIFVFVEGRRRYKRDVFLPAICGALSQAHWASCVSEFGYLAECGGIMEANQPLGR